jgi:hypothetical protein
MGLTPRPGDELGRWADERAPAILARAEAEAVAALRDALVTAAIAAHREPPATGREAEAPAVGRHSEPETPLPAPAPQTGRERPEPGELLWAYCVLREADPHPPQMTGVDEHNPVVREQASGLVALVSRVPRAQFAAEPLRRNLNDLPWLERVARRHEAVLEAALAVSTIVPLRMCTLYENAESIRTMLEREKDSLDEALAALDGRLEWAVKVLIDPAKLMAVARTRGDPHGLEEEQEARGEGGAYMLRRRLERALRESADALAAEVSQRVHARLQDWAIDATTRPPQNRELSGHSGEMVLNAAYLVERERSDELRNLVSELEGHHRELGVQIELTGPWPPYNFVPGGVA